MRNFMFKSLVIWLVGVFCATSAWSQNELISYKLNLVKHPYTKSGRAKCTACDGSGKCKSCHGTGKCKYCHGTGKG